MSEVDNTFNSGRKIHPTTLYLVDSKEKNTKLNSFKYGNNRVTFFDETNKNINNISTDEIVKNMLVPYVGLDTKSILNIYEIKTFDELVTWVDDTITSLEYDTVNRIVNIWIKNNLQTKSIDLKNYNDALNSLLFKILKKYKKSNKSEKELSKFIDNWLNKKDLNDFDFDLLGDFLNK